MKKVKTLSAWFRSNLGVQRNRFNEAHFATYTKSIGSLLLAWNDLHETLGTLFFMAMGMPQFERTRALWNETRNDMGKRQLLRAAINNLPASEIRKRSNIVVEIEWILDTANKLGGYRDDSAQTPLAQLLATPGVRTIVPHTRFANPRALRMAKDKDLLVEYRYARERILVLRDYAIANGNCALHCCLLVMPLSAALFDVGCADAFTADDSLFKFQPDWFRSSRQRDKRFPVYAASDVSPVPIGPSDAHI
jgi:hypothetical protein